MTSADLLVDAFGRIREVVHEQTARYVAGLTDADLDSIVDRSWDPPVSLGVRLAAKLRPVDANYQGRLP